jgi:hypothetical protein
VRQNFLKNFLNKTAKKPKDQKAQDIEKSAKISQFFHLIYKFKLLFIEKAFQQNENKKIVKKQT